MKRRPLLLLAILVYITLDLSLPTMPGAFVFDPAGSVESVDGGRARPMDNAIVVPAPAHSWLLWRPPLHDHGYRRRPSSDVGRSSRFVVSCLPRAVCAQPAPSEDPH